LCTYAFGIVGKQWNSRKKQHFYLLNECKLYEFKYNYVYINLNKKEVLIKMIVFELCLLIKSYNFRNIILSMKHGTMLRFKRKLKYDTFLPYKEF
jgi:hypothetical protein